MKTISRTSIFLLAGIFILCSGLKCKKLFMQPGADILPAETQTGKNTFGCLVDGAIFLPKGIIPQPGLTASIQYNIISLDVSRNGGDSMILVIRNFIQPGTYALTKKDNFFFFSRVEFKCIEGSMTIKKYDPIANILSGTFQAKGQNSAGTIVNITEGRFDVRFTN